MLKSKKNLHKIIFFLSFSKGLLNDPRTMLSFVNRLFLTRISFFPHSQSIVS